MAMGPLVVSPLHIADNAVEFENQFPTGTTDGWFYHRT